MLFPNVEGAPREPHDLTTLIEAGDWACAHGNRGGLREVAFQLGLCISGDEQSTLHQVEVLADHDMRAASETWWRVTQQIRAKLFGGNQGFERRGY